MDVSSSNKEDAQTPRRGRRAKKLSLKALESLYIKEIQASNTPLKDIKSESENDDCDIEEEPGKSSVLHENETLGGSKIFSFQKRKARNSLVQKVSEVRGSVPKTPHHVRHQLKKKIVANTMDSSSEDPFSDSGSEYVASDASESEEQEDSNVESSNDSEHSDSDKEVIKQRPISKQKSQSKQIPMLPGKKVTKARQNKKYFIKTDDYFSSHSTKKILTSNHTLDKLETPRLPQDQLKMILEKLKLTDEHEKCIKDLTDANKSYFSKWFYLMQEGFNILLYGLGCKRHILENFHREHLNTLPVIVVNGFFPTITIKDLLDGIIVDLLGVKENPSNAYEACDLIQQELSYIPETHVYLIVHNIEGEMLRNKKAQDILARLASVKNIHLIASIDHINAPLIWDHSKLSKFNYTWWDVTSFLPYIEETSFESSLLVQGTGSLALSSLRNVFLSLTTNSKGIYLIIVKYQLENGKNQYYQGQAFKDLYWSCREAFLVSSDLALRAQLNEFVDHKMIKYKRSADGTEYVFIPIANPLLKKFLDEQSK